MVVIPGLTDSLRAVGKRITHFDTTVGGLALDVASTVRPAQCPKMLAPQLAPTRPILAKTHC